jgi:hypothetical protein
MFVSASPWSVKTLSYEARLLNVADMHLGFGLAASVSFRAGWDLAVRLFR